MKGFAKFAVIISGIIAVIIIAAFIILKTVVTPERVKQAVLPFAQKALHRDVTLNDVNISIFSGIELQGLTIMNREGKAPFVSCEAARLHYDLMPLLQGRVQIHEVTIVSPLIHITRNSDGTFNFSDLLSKGPAESGGRSKGAVLEAHAAEATPAKKEPAGEDSASDAPKQDLAIAVSQINVDNGKVIFTDNAAPGGRGVETTLSGLNLQVDNFSTTSPFPVKLETRLNNGSITAQGTLNLQGPEAVMNITTSGIAVTDFAPYFASALPGKLESAVLGTDLNIRYDSSGIKSAGKVRVEKIGFIPKDIAEAAIKNAFVELDHDILFSGSKGSLAINSASLVLNGIKIAARGDITGINATPLLALDVTLPQQNPKDMIKALPAAYAAKAEAFRPEGKIAASLRLSGKADQGARLLKHATLSMQSLTADADGIPAGADGKLTLDADRLTSSGLVLHVGKYDIRTEITARKIFSKPIIVRTKMTSDEIDLDSILAARNGKDAKDTSTKTAESGQGEKSNGIGSTGSKAGKRTTKASEPPPLNLPLDAAGTVYVALLKYHNVPIRAVNIRYTLKHNKLHITQTSQLAGGKIEKNLDLDLGVKGYRYSGDFNISNVLAQQLLSYASPSMAKAVSGILDLKGNFSGAGIASEAIKKNLNLKGNWSLLDATLAKTGIVSGLVSFLNLGNDLQKIDVKNAHGDFMVKDGNVIFKGKFSSDRINLAPQGTVSLDGDLDIHLNAVLSPELASKIPAGQFLTPMKDSRGWSILPLMVKGTWSSPSITLDTGAVTDQAAGFLKNKLLGIGKSKTDQTGKEQTQEKEEKRPEEQLLENAIKGIFGN